MKKTLAALASAVVLATCAAPPPAYAAGYVYIKHGRDIGWTKPGTRAISVQDYECDGRQVTVRYHLRNGKLGTLADADGCMGQGIQRYWLSSSVRKFRVCEEWSCTSWKWVPAQ